MDEILKCDHLKVTNQYFMYRVVLPFESVRSTCVSIQAKATSKYFSTVLNEESVEEITENDNSIKVFFPEQYMCPCGSN